MACSSRGPRICMSKEGDNAFALWSRGAIEASSCSSMMSRAKGSVRGLVAPRRLLLVYCPAGRRGGRHGRGRIQQPSTTQARLRPRHHRLQLPTNRGEGIYQFHGPALGGAGAGTGLWRCIDSQSKFDDELERTNCPTIHKSQNNSNI